VLFAAAFADVSEGDYYARYRRARCRARWAPTRARGAAPELNERVEGDGANVFEHACKLGLEGIVSKRKGSRYSSGRSLHWLKSKNPASPAVRREAEEELGGNPRAYVGGRNQDNVLVARMARRLPRERVTKPPLGDCNVANSDIGCCRFSHHTCSMRPTRAAGPGRAAGDFR